MTADDFESRTDSETKYWNKRILESDAIYVVSAGATDRFTHCLVAGPEAFEDGEFDSRLGHNFLGRPRAFSLGRGLDKAANKPAGQPSRLYLLHGSDRFAFQSCRERRQIDFIRDAQMLQALPDTPCTLGGPPVELLNRERAHQFAGPAIGIVELAHQAR